MIYLIDALSPTESMPTFDVPYEATRMKDSRYHCIAMMPAYRNYSFEELRLAYPHKRVLKTENVLVASVGNGEYGVFGLHYFFIICYLFCF